MSLGSALWALTVSEPDDLLLIDWQDGSRREQSWFPVEDDRRFERMLGYHVAGGNAPCVSLVPRRDRHPDGVSVSSVLWAHVENTVAARSLAAFRPAPSLVLRYGKSSRRTAIWWMDKPLRKMANPADDWVGRANRRLAYCLKANSRCARPEWLMPVGNVTVEHADSAARYTPAQVVKALRDPPVRRVPQAGLRGF